MCRLTTIKPCWWRNVRATYKAIQKWFIQCGVEAPTITKCKPRGNWYTTKKSPKKHANNLLFALAWKADGNGQVYIQLRNAMFEVLKVDILKYFGLKLQLTAMNTHYLQDEVQLSNAKWQKICSKVNQFVGYKLFASKGDTLQLRKRMKSKTAYIGRARLDISTEVQYRHQFQTNKEYFVFHCQATEIICHSLNRDINSNNFVNQPMAANQIWVQIAGDKGGPGYCESVAVVANNHSAAKSMASIYVPTDPAETYNNLAKIEQSAPYDKIQLSRRLIQSSMVISFIKYCVNINDDGACLLSRLSSSCVVTFTKFGQQKLDLDQKLEQLNYFMTMPHFCSFHEGTYDNDIQYLAKEDFQPPLQLTAKQRKYRWENSLRMWVSGWVIVIPLTFDIENIEGRNKK